MGTEPGTEKTDTGVQCTRADFNQKMSKKTKHVPYETLLTETNTVYNVQKGKRMFIGGYPKLGSEPGGFPVFRKKEINSISDIVHLFLDIWIRQNMVCCQMFEELCDNPAAPSSSPVRTMKSVASPLSLAPTTESAPPKSILRKVSRFPEGGSSYYLQQLKKEYKRLLHDCALEGDSLNPQTVAEYKEAIRELKVHFCNKLL